jgi:hypothetical protein
MRTVLWSAEVNFALITQNVAALQREIYSKCPGQIWNLAAWRVCTESAAKVVRMDWNIWCDWCNIV